MSFFINTTILTILVFFLNNQTLYATAEQQSGFVTAIEGDVRLYRLPVSTGKSEIPTDAITARWEGKDYKAFSARLYSKVYEGDVIVTGDNSKTKLVMSGSNTLVVGSLTNFIIKTAKNLGNDNSKSSFKILYGKIRSIVKSKIVGNGKYEVSTPSSVIGVRGTDFYTTYSPQSATTTVSTLEGVVSVKNLEGKIKKEVLVESGYSTTVINLSDVDIAKMKELKKTKAITAIPSTPTKVKAIDLNQIKDISSIETQLNKIEIDIKNMKEAKDSEQKALELIKTKNIDTSKDPLNMSLDNLIEKALKEEKTRQRDKGSLDKIDNWIKNY